jgi:hypothetical protein
MLRQTLRNFVQEFDTLLRRFLLTLFWTYRCPEMILHYSFLCKSPMHCVQ